jgi:hypothetical protein
MVFKRVNSEYQTNAMHCYFIPRRGDAARFGGIADCLCQAIKKKMFNDKTDLKGAQVRSDSGFGRVIKGDLSSLFVRASTDGL